MAHSGSHNEDYHLKKMFEHHQCLMNEHHKTTVVMYKCKLTGRMIDGGGRRVQERLEYLLENDIQLKNAILDDGQSILFDSPQSRNFSRVTRLVNLRLWDSTRRRWK